MNELRSDFIVVGSGIAGLRAACALADAGDVLILTKADPAESNTGYAQGGIAAAIGPDDSPALHAEDTLNAGDGLSDERAVRVLVEDGARDVAELVAWGARFDRAADGSLALGREAAHSVRRVLHARDATGREIGRTLWVRASAMPRVRVLTDTLVTRLICGGSREAACTGVEFVDARAARGRARAPRVLLATGGAGQVYRETTNPSVATGDGIALAYRAGARVADLEFVQFHPTVLNVPHGPRFLLSEALRGEGARLVNQKGEAFMERYHPAADLAPRDVVARSIAREAERTGGPIYLTLAHLAPDFVRARFPTIAEMCQQLGFDLARDPVPVGPAAHYLMGGVETDGDGRTSIPGLFAAGEVACTRVHGANRLASNSLLEGLVFGRRAGQAMKGPLEPARLPEPKWMAPGFSSADREVAAPGFSPAGLKAGATLEGGTGADLESVAPGFSPAQLTVDAIRDLMWRAVGLFRERAGLATATARLAAADRPDAPPGDLAAWRAATLATVGFLIARAALRREESRGAHFRSDFPARDDLHWKVHLSDVRPD